MPSYFFLCFVDFQQKCAVKIVVSIFEFVFVCRLQFYCSVTKTFAKIFASNDAVMFFFCKAFGLERLFVNCSLFSFRQLQAGKITADRGNRAAEKDARGC